MILKANVLTQKLSAVDATSVLIVILLKTSAGNVNRMVVKIAIFVRTANLRNAIRNARNRRNRRNRIQSVRSATKIIAMNVVSVLLALIVKENVKKHRSILMIMMRFVFCVNRMVVLIVINAKSVGNVKNIVRR